MNEAARLDNELTAGVADMTAGRMSQAETRFRRILAAHPTLTAALANLGVVRFALGDAEEAVRLLQKAVTIEPRFATAHLALGQICDRLGRLPKALEHYGIAEQLMPDRIDVRLARAYALRRAGQLAAARDAFAALLTRQPNHRDALVGLGDVLLTLGDVAQAARCADRALTLASGSAAVHYLVGRVARAAWQLTGAIVHYRRAVDLQPEFAEAHHGLANALTLAGQPDDAVAHYRRALDLRPHDVATHSNYLMCLQYRERLPADEWTSALSGFAANVPAPAAAARGRRSSDRSRLRVGYVSPDFRSHSCAWFIAPLFAAHDRQACEITAFAAVEQPDAITERLKGLADHWVDIRAVSDSAAAATIRDRRIDVLVDLAGHTAGGRLGVFALKPAPVQVAWLGFPASTGLAAIDYRLTDRWLAPAGTPEPFTEALWRLDRVSHAYGPPPDAPDVAPPPCLGRRPITFGSFNNFAKISPTTLDLWAGAMLAVPGSRLLLKDKGVRDAGLCDRIVEGLAARGVARDAVAFLPGAATTAEHLGCYGQIDIALDTFPYNGATTTLEALWMGVPVISLGGDRAASRFGIAALAQLDLVPLAAASCDDFIAKARELAAPERLAALRPQLRPRMAASSLLDAADFAQAVEAAFRSMVERTVR